MPYILIDTHAHLNFQAFEKDLEEVIRQAHDEEVKVIINVGADLTSSQKAVELAQKYEGCFASVGVHPHHAIHYDTSAYHRELERLARQPKVVAIGECGLDYHPYQNDGIADPKKQEDLFWAHLQLAQELNLPVILHCRQAHQEILKLLYRYIDTSIKIRGVFHCFSGDEKFLKEVLSLGFYVGFDGNITYKNAQNLRDLVKLTPLARFLLETDCPYLSPEPFRGLRNTPANVKIIAKAVAQIKNLPETEIAAITSKNAQKLFRLPIF